ncbi:DUF6531 domain-containing protein, partial [Dokdonella sp.]|uniref:DUF6531 domain-containing protein n=1 Tax=Dokdonella sp. TaxID=2291710 RepID=UPI0025B95891
MLRSIQKKNLGSCPAPTGGSPSTPNPISIALGNKFLDEADIQSVGFSLHRFYNSGNTGRYITANSGRVGSFGPGWSHTFEARLDVSMTISGSFAAIIAAQRPDGRTLTFVRMSVLGPWVSDADISERIIDVRDAAGVVIGYQLVDRGDRVESYDSAGLLQSIVDQRRSQSFALIRDSAGRVMSVTDRSGRALSFKYNSMNRIVGIFEPGVDPSDPSATAWGYGYDASGRLVSVTSPAAGTREYHYEDVTFPDALTGVTDEAGRRYASYSYDVQGRAYAENLWAGPGQTLPVNQFTLTFQPNKLTHVVDPLGKARDYQFKIVQGVAVLENVSDLCALCGGSGATESRTYDPVTGFTDLVTDFNGGVTDFDYDSRGLEAKRIDASNDLSPPAASSKRTTETIWNPNFRVPDQRTVKNASGATESLTKWVYNTRGQPTARCEVDPAIGSATSYTCGSATNAPVGVRQTRTTYCEQPDVTAGSCPLVGLVTSVNGPRA